MVLCTRYDSGRPLNVFTSPFGTQLNLRVLCPVFSFSLRFWPLWPEPALLQSFRPTDWYDHFVAVIPRSYYYSLAAQYFLFAIEKLISPLFMIFQRPRRLAVKAFLKINSRSNDFSTMTIYYFYFPLMQIFESTVKREKKSRRGGGESDVTRYHNTQVDISRAWNIFDWLSCYIVRGKAIPVHTVRIHLLCPIVMTATNHEHSVNRQTNKLARLR